MPQQTRTHPNPKAWKYLHTAAEVAAFAHADPLYAADLQQGNRVEADGDTLIIHCRTITPGPSTVAVMTATPNQHGEWWCETWITYEPTKLSTNGIPLSLLVHWHTSEPDMAEWLQDWCGAQPWWNFLRAITHHLFTAADRRHTAVE